MKKIITILLILLILTIPFVSKAAIEVTEEKLINTVEKIQKDFEKEGDNLKITIDKENNLIVLTDLNTGNKYDMSYNLDKKPQLSIEIKLTKDMTQEEMMEEYMKIILPYLGFAMVADIGDIELVDSSMYFMMKILEGFNSNEIFDFEEMMQQGGITSDTEIDFEKIKELYGNSTEININDELFTFSLKEDKVTDKECILKVTLTVNTDKDFSILDGYAEKVAKEMGFLDNINGNNNMVNQNKNVTSNISKIPQTGNEISLVKILTTIIIVCAILMLSLPIYNKKTN